MDDQTGAIEDITELPDPVQDRLEVIADALRADSRIIEVEVDLSRRRIIVTPNIASQTAARILENVISRHHHVMARAFTSKGTAHWQVAVKLHSDFGRPSGASLTNGDRAAFAAEAVDAYHLRTRHELGPERGDTDAWHEVLSDLLCDLHHLADSEGVDWPSIVSRADGHYTAELAEEVDHA